MKWVQGFLILWCIPLALFAADLPFRVEEIEQFVTEWQQLAEQLKSIDFQGLSETHRKEYADIYSKQAAALVSKTSRYRDWVEKNAELKEAEKLWDWSLDSEVTTFGHAERWNAAKKFIPGIVLPPVAIPVGLYLLSIANKYGDPIQPLLEASGAMGAWVAGIATVGFGVAFITQYLKSPREAHMLAYERIRKLHFARTQFINRSSFIEGEKWMQLARNLPLEMLPSLIRSYILDNVSQDLWAYEPFASVRRETLQRDPRMSVEDLSKDLTILFRRPSFQSNICSRVSQQAAP